MTPLPPLGSRFGDLTAEERESLPVGTVLALSGVGWPPPLTLTVGGWRDAGGDGSHHYGPLDPDRRIASYPEPPPAPPADPRDTEIARLTRERDEAVALLRRVSEAWRAMHGSDPWASVVRVSVGDATAHEREHEAIRAFLARSTT